ncbi:MAG: hypothetical protein JXA10_04455 [Anaerolineae bacterium]|nr:hypothetical protein [Anaerolineae bacterium]
MLIDAEMLNIVFYSNSELTSTGGVTFTGTSSIRLYQEKVELNVAAQFVVKQPQRLNAIWAYAYIYYNYATPFQVLSGSGFEKLPRDSCCSRELEAFEIWGMGMPIHIGAYVRGGTPERKLGLYTVNIYLRTDRIDHDTPSFLHNIPHASGGLFVTDR